MWPPSLNSTSPPGLNGNKMYSSVNAHGHHHPTRLPSRHHPPRGMNPPGSNGSASPDSMYHHHSHNNRHWPRHNSHSGHHSHHHHHHSSSPSSSRDRYDYHRYHHDPPSTHHRHQQHYPSHSGNYRKSGMMDDRYYRHSSNSDNLSPNHSNEFYHARSSPNFHQHVNNNNYHNNPSYDTSRNHHHNSLKPNENHMTSPKGAMPTLVTSGVSTSAGGCTCKKSRCLKLYCQCFASSNKCDPSKCKCQSCHNTVLHESYIQEARRVILDRNPCAFQDKFTNSESPLSHEKSQEKKPHKQDQVYRKVYIKEEERQEQAGKRKEEEHPELEQNHQTSESPSHQDGANNLPSSSQVYSAVDDDKQDHDETMQENQEDVSHTKKESNRRDGIYEINVTPDRRASSDSSLTKYSHEDSIKGHSNNGEDRMAIMAALAMTELCAGKGKPIVVEQEDDEEKQEKHKFSTPIASSSIAVSEEKPKHSDSLSIDINDQRQSHRNQENNNRKREFDDANSATETFAIKRSRRPTSTLSKTSLERTSTHFTETNVNPNRTGSDQSGLSVVSSTCSPSNKHQFSSPPNFKKSHEVTPHSRNSSPISTMPTHMRHDYAHNYQSPHTRYHSAANSRRSDHHGLQSPPSYSRHFYSTRAMPSPIGKMMSPESTPPNNICHFMNTSSPLTKKFLNTNKSSNPSGLPKALSFRKICSKCGKTRGEHGELGFGNKCVYQDCGRCGAGVQMHVKAGSPMGFFCKLKVEDGATPGASEAYEKKIQQLAIVAELKKESGKQSTAQTSA